MHFGRLLEAQNGFAAVTSVRMATGEQLAFGDVHAVFVTTNFDLRDGNEHSGKLAAAECGVKYLFAEGARRPLSWPARKNGLSTAFGHVERGMLVGGTCQKAVETLFQ
jgi:hypothetical protein